MNISICALKRSVHHLSTRRVHAIHSFAWTNGLRNITISPSTPLPYHQLQTTRNFKIDHLNMSPLDVEKELFKLKRQMGAYYSKAAYAEALKVANELNREVLDIMGSNNAVHASCLNNIGLMQKMLGNKEAALEKYNESLAIYEEVVGKNHMSYINTSSNIGVLYKSMADSAESEEDYWKYLDLAEDILKKSLAARIDLHGPSAKEVLINQNHLATILRSRGKVEEAEAIFNAVLVICREDRAVGNWDSVTALTLNNLGLLLKQFGSLRWPEAEKCYKEAVKIRTETFGESHQDSIVSMHNLAEFYITRGESGDQETAGKLQQKILDILGADYKNDEWSDDAVYDSLPTATKHGEVIDKVEHDQDEREESKNKIKAEKAARLEGLRQQREKETETKTNTDGERGGIEGHSAPAGEVGGYYPGESTLPPPRSPITAFLRVAKPPAGPEVENKNNDNDNDGDDGGDGGGDEGEDVKNKERKEKKQEDDVLRKIYDSMMNKNSE